MPTRRAVMQSAAPRRSQQRRTILIMAKTETPDIIYTKVDEAPELASASLLPIIRAFASAAGISVETRNISLAGRVLSAFPDFLTEDQRVADDLAELGELVKTPEANVIKLPNISASMPQLAATIKELQAQGFALPDYPEEPATDAERDIKARYDAVKGSAVNPVLRRKPMSPRCRATISSPTRPPPRSVQARRGAPRSFSPPPMAPRRC